MGLLKSEIKYISFAIGFAFVWFVLAVPKLLELGIQESSPYLQFLIFNIGIFIFLQIFLKSRVQNSRINIAGSIGVIALIMALDIMIPPLTVSSQGELLTGPILVASSTDYVMGYLAGDIGLQGVYIFLFTYILIPTILLFIAANLIPNFVKEL